MRLEDIGFYTLSDERAVTASSLTPLSRCELILTSRCNFKCPYCRRVGGSDLDLATARRWVETWGLMGCKAIRFSGGEPTLYPHLLDLVRLSALMGIERIAVSTNGSAKPELYKALLEAGVNDFSISLDACCAADAMKMGVTGSFRDLVETIRWLSEETYTTVGLVVTEENAPKVGEIIAYASSLGVADIRVIPAAQEGIRLPGVYIPEETLVKHPILRYRLANMNSGDVVRGLTNRDAPRCGLVLDDMAACGEEHFPCVIYMREGGQAIGKLGPELREERQKWFLAHEVKGDPICSRNCLDVCRDYNRRFAER